VNQYYTRNEFNNRSVILQNLYSLGHVEFNDNEWIISDPTIIINNNSAFLSGLRNNNIINKFENFSNEINGDFENRFYSNLSPAWIGIKNLEKPDELSEKYFNNEIKIENEISRKILESTPDNWSEIIKKKIETSKIPKNERCQKYNLNTHLWEEIMYEEAPGAYRIKNNQTHYVFFDGKNYYESDFRIIKYLYSIYEKQNLFDYDYKNKELSTPLGEQLPQLFDKAITLESGYSYKVDGRIIYQDVSEKIASYLLYKIYLKN
jgi:hypothetical protein